MFEGRVGKGYLIVSGTGMFVKNPFIADDDIENYYLNLFALGCGEQDFGKYEKVVLPVPSFKQGLVPYDGTDPYWENNIYNDGASLDLWCDGNGDGASMAECACALTSASMVMNYHGVERSPGGVFPQNPAYLNFFANELFPDLNGGEKGFFGGSFNWHYAENFSADSAEFNDNKKVEFASRENFSADRVKELIDEDKPVIVNVTGKWGEHWLVVKGYDVGTGRLIINDPALPDPPVGQYSYLAENYTPNEIGSMIVYQKTSSDFRRLQFATSSLNQILVVDSLGNKTGFDPQDGFFNEIPNSDYSLDKYYGDATSTEDLLPATEGIHFLTISLPEDGKYGLEVFSQNGEPHPVQVYSSDTEGKLAGKVLEPNSTEVGYNAIYLEDSAGEEINVSLSAQIDITPFIDSNVIIPFKWMPVGVAVLASDSFDVEKVDADSLTFGKTGDEESLKFCLQKLVDVNRDGKEDLLCYFYADKTGLYSEDTEAILKGIYDGFPFEGMDSVKVFKPSFLF